MPEMTFGALVSRTNNIDVPFQEVIKALVGILLLYLPASFAQ